MSKQPPPAPTASTVGLCPTVIQIVALYQILQNVVLQGCKQIPSLRQTVSLLRENINIHVFINVTYLYMLRVSIYKIHNMIPLLCTKVKFI